MSALIRWLGQFWDSIVKFFKAFLLTFFDMIKDFACWIFDQILTGVHAAIASFDLSLNLACNWSGLPDTMTNFLGLLHFGTALGILIAACLVKITLKLIPFSPFK